MAPTYYDGQWLLTEPLNRPLRRGDVVVINSPAGTIIKRIALLPGDRHLQFKTGHGWVETLPMGVGRLTARLYRYETVPEGTVFVLGDHLFNSIDSREFGVVRISDIRRLVPSDGRPSSRSEIAQTQTKPWSLT